MKIAFVGKGGSGKSTVSALFTQYLVQENQNILAVDADINQHFASMIGASFEKNLALSNEDQQTTIHTHLRGANSKIDSIDKFVKTTPPGKGSNLIHLQPDDPIIASHSTKFSKTGYFMHVGTYGEEGIGTSCYHGNLAIFENILSHVVTGKDDWLVGDMVAGTDAFAGALYLMFDVIFLVVEPTPESIGVFNQFQELAQTSGVSERVFVVGNKIVDDDDLAYLRNAVGNKLVCSLPQDSTLRKARQQGMAFTEKNVAAFQTELEHIKEFALAHKPHSDETLSRLYDLHLHYTSQDHVQNKHGDLSGQIDKEFHYDSV